MLCARLLCCLVTLTPVFGVGALDAHAFELRVRGQSKLYADVRGAGNTLQISGVLRDELGQPLLQRVVTMTVSAQGEELFTQPLVTDMQGRFRFTKQMNSGDYAVALAFEESEHLDGATLESSVTLKPSVYTALLQAPPYVVGMKQPVKVRLRAMADGVGVSTDVTVLLGDKEVGVVALDHYGRGVLDVSKHIEPGPNVFTARIQQGQRLLFTPPTTLQYTPRVTITAALSKGYVGLERGLKVQGSVLKANATPMPKGDVFVYFEPVLDMPSPGQPAPKPSGRIEATLDEDGAFAGLLSDAQASEGAWRARVVYEPPVGEAAQLTTEAFVIDRTSTRWILHVLGILTILVGVVALAQRATWARLGAALGRLRRRPKARGPVAIEREHVVEAQAVEEIPEELAQASERDIAGFVWDPWRAQVVAGARLRVLDGDALIAQGTSGADGRFALKELPERDLSLYIDAPGFAMSKMAMRLPHQGQLRYFRVDLIDMALKVRKFYQSWVRRWHPKEAWGKLTPREIEVALLEVVDHVEASGSSSPREQWGQALRSLIAQEQDLSDLSVQRTMELLTQLIEESYYSQRLYGDDMWRLFVDVTTKLEGHLSPQPLRRRS